MTYENENLSEPTCEGHWWRKSAAGRLTVENVFRAFQGFVYYAWHRGRFPCREPGVVWNGPIPVPNDIVDRMFTGNLPSRDPEEERALRESVHDGDVEDCPKCGPAPSEDLPSAAEFKACADGRRARAGRFMGMDAEGNPAPSEDEGEKWGELLAEICGRFPWENIPERVRKLYCARALRFRAECMAPLEKAVKEVLLAFRGYGDIGYNGPMTAEELREAEQKVHSELGAAIEHLSDALPEQDEPEKMGLPDGTSLVIDPDKVPPIKSRVSDEELGRFATGWLQGVHFGSSVLINLGRRALACFGAAIRAKLGDKE